MTSKSHRLMIGRRSCGVRVARNAPRASLLSRTKLHRVPVSSTIARTHENCYADSNHMLGTAISPALAPRTDRNAYVVWMGIIWAAILGGFALGFSRYMGEVPPPPIILHIHGAIYAIWLVLVSVQIFLVQTGDIQLHMRLGWATAIVSAAMVPLGLIAAMVDQARQAGHPDYAPQFLALEFEEMSAFSTFITAGLLSRRNLAEQVSGGYGRC